MSELSDVKQEEQAADVGPDNGDGEAEAPARAPKEEPVLQVKPPRRLNIIGRRNLFFALSLLVIIPGIISMWRYGFLLGIDFAGGTELTVSFANKPSLAQVTNAVSAEGFNGSVLQTGNGYIIRYPVLTATQLNNVQTDLKSRLGPTNVQQMPSLPEIPTVAVP